MNERASKVPARTSGSTRAIKAYGGDIDMTETDQEKSQSPTKGRSRGHRLKAEREPKSQVPISKGARAKND